MPEKTTSRKTPVRKLKVRSIKIGRCYTAKDANKALGIDESVFHRWIREEGLVPIDSQKPTMVHWRTLKQFAEHKNQSYKMGAGNAGDLPCMKCYMKKRAYEDKITIKKINSRFWKGNALCVDCGTPTTMNVPADEFLLTITWGYEVVETLPMFTILGSKYTNARTTGSRRRKEAKFEASGEIVFCADNERIKHKYFIKLERKFDKKRTVPAIISAISLYEEYTRYKDFKKFSYDDVIGFQKFIVDKYPSQIGSANRKINCVREFFFWLREQSGYKKIKYDDVDDLQLSLKDQERARATKPKDCLDALNWQELILNLKPQTDIEYRGQAMLATLLLTSARLAALLSFQIGDFNLDRNYVFQDSQHVDAKFGSSWKTNLWRFKPEIRQILERWIKKLKIEHGFSNNDPLFPRINITTNEMNFFEMDGFQKVPLKSQSILREELYKQLENAGLEHYTPHTIRNSLIALVYRFPLTPEQIKAVSQNMSHKNLGTTMNGYFKVAEYRQDAIVEELDIEQQIILEELKKNPKFQYIMSQLDNEEAVDKVFRALVDG